MILYIFQNNNHKYEHPYFGLKRSRFRLLFFVGFFKEIDG
ncbi:hypothetical protein P872_04255 [Rhodonellum psychrophilum GCM71 = DSM 17998]|uniref:Uncharacterized protein n=1 Tax=Rhodonellum psychrophilum GCM71 = DSM 17998 TaxID=1123057 RepID=U5C1C9_9BACT|nr:hypothetical protein P872_04255 [Rhodonellum psychrophilum GCM71 = DSM 17998]